MSKNIRHSPYINRLGDVYCNRYWSNHGAVWNLYRVARGLAWSIVHTLKCYYMHAGIQKPIPKASDSDMSILCDSIVYCMLYIPVEWGHYVCSQHWLKVKMIKFLVFSTILHTLHYFRCYHDYQSVPGWPHLEVVL